LFRFEEVPTARGNSMNVVADAVHLCDPTDVMDHISHGLYQLSSYVFRGLPPGWEIRQDVDAFLKSVTFKYDGETVNPRSWPLGRNGPPIFEGMSHLETIHDSGGDVTTGVVSTSTDRNLARQKAFLDFAEQEHNFGHLIPLVSEDYVDTFDCSAVALGSTAPSASMGNFSSISSYYHNSLLYIGVSKRKQEGTEHIRSSSE